MSNDVNQLNLIHQFNEENRIPFNPELFQDSDEGILEGVKQVVLSCNREGFFTIRVEGFELIEDYDKIQIALREYEETRNKSDNRDNVYDYINLKDTDMRLLIVYYYIAIKEESEHIKVLIGLPRTVDKYYFRINGNIYSAMWQIVDASTYNSSTSSSKRDSVTLKTLFQPLRVYRYQTYKKYDLTDYATGEKVRCTYFTSFVFKKSFLAMKYILAKFGFYGAMEFLYLDCIWVSDHDPLEDGINYKEFYIFEKHGIFITTPREIFANCVELQSFIYTVLYSITRDTTYDNFFSRDNWLIAIAMEFNNKTVEKGLSILESFEFVLDRITQEDLALPEEDKKDVYCVLRWMIMEFSNLKLKSNLDVSIKRVRRGKCISSLYAIKLSTSIYRISDIGKKANIDSIKKALRTHPMYLLNAITNCRLANYRNFVNDLDALVALKFTFKGIAGIGEKNNSMPNIYRAVSKYQLGITDPDSSSPGDPGASGTLCPTAKVYENGMLSEFKEPNYWRESIDNLFRTYKEAVGLKECLVAMNKMLGANTDDKVYELNQSISHMDNIVKPLVADSIVEADKNELESSAAASMMQFNHIPLENSGHIIYEPGGIDDGG